MRGGWGPLCYCLLHATNSKRLIREWRFRGIALMHFWRVDPRPCTRTDGRIAERGLPYCTPLHYTHPTAKSPPISYVGDNENVSSWVLDVFLFYFRDFVKFLGQNVLFLFKLNHKSFSRLFLNMNVKIHTRHYSFTLLKIWSLSPECEKNEINLKNGTK